MIAASGFMGKKIFTMDLQFPRVALAEFLTHRVMSKNTASTRAIPLKSHVEHVRANTYMPDWTRNQGGMSGGVLSEASKEVANENLLKALDYMCDFVEFLGGDEKFGNLHIHKQDAGRYIEPFSYITLRVTSTQWKNFLWLRNDEAAYPPMQVLAKLVQTALDEAEVFELKEGEYHLPDIRRERGAHTGEIYYYSPEGVELTLQQAIEMSMSLCAQQSFRKADSSEAKTESVIDKLFNGNKVHASPSEHPAMALDEQNISFIWPEGVTHLDRKGNYWSGNFKGWIQHRQLLPNHDAELM